jgi:tetratricopeptide (TPR) repeat protein
VDFWNGLIPLSMACGDYEHAQELCRRLTELRPEDVNAWLQWLAVAVDQKDFATADNALAKVEQIDRGGPVTSYCRAAVLAARNKPAEALAEIKKTLADRPTWAPALRLAASQEEAEGQLESALEHSLAAIDAGTNDVDTYSRAIRLLYGRGQFDQAAKLLDRVGEQSISLDLNLQRLRLVVSGERNDLDLALRTAESIAAGSKDHRDQVRLGLLLSARAARERGAGQEAVAEESLKKAEQVLRAAREQAPDAPETWTALLRLLVTNNRTVEADQLLADAIVKFGAQGPSLDLAKCQLAAGRDDDAAKVYEALLASKPLAVDVVRQAAEFCLRSGRPQMAMEQLRETVAGRIAADKNNVIWCRRALAMALGEQASKTNLDEALRLVRQNLDVDPSSVLDRRTKAVLLSGQPQRAARQEAIQILEELLRSGTPGEAETRTRLGQLYLAMGDWDRALPHLRTSTDPSALIAFVRGSLQRKQFAEAEQGLNLLDKLPLAPSVTAILRAELLFQRGESDQSLQVLAEMVANAAESARANALLSAAVTAEGFAQSPQASSDKFTASCLDRAESYLRTRAELGANEQMDLAAFIARRHRYDEAIGILEQMSANAGVAEIARGISGFAGSPSPDPQVTRRIENVVAAALEKHKRPFALINSYIRLLVLWERWDEVEKLYREIIDRDAGNFTARNNLAELLALRGKNLDDALMLIQTALEFTGDLATLVDTRAVVYMARGQFDAAVRDMLFVIDGEPRPNRFFHLARAYDGANQPAAATKALKKAVELGLTSDQLHPLERSGFVELAKKLQ